VTADVPPIPEALLAPLLDDAATVLRGLPTHEIPASLRSVAGFDARGLSRGAARRQLLRAVSEHDEFRGRAVERFLERRDAQQVLEAWVPSDALRIVRESMDATALPMLVSTLFAGRPAAWAFGIGAACEAGMNESRLRTLGQEAGSRANQHRMAVEARQRAEAERAAVERAMHHLEQERRDERRARRARDDELAAEREAASRAQAELEDALARARGAEERAIAHAEREAERARGFERELSALAHALPPSDPAPLRAAAAEARLLAERLDALADDRLAAVPASPPASPPASSPVASSGVSPAASPAAVGASSGTTSAERPAARSSVKPRRNRPPCPAGLAVDTPAGLDAVLRNGGVLLVVDGYNVTKTAWGAASAEEQRTRLLAALSELHLRLRCDIVVAFDGADVRGVPLPRGRGVRVVFSGAGEEADDVVVREAAAPPRTVPVVVVSSDGAVRRRSEAEGAVAVGANTLLAVLRR
jgi:predicted RNA-binding protein with PIN domain